MMELKGINYKTTTIKKKKKRQYFRFNSLFVNRYYSFTFPCSFLMWEM